MSLLQIFPCTLLAAVYAMASSKSKVTRGKEKARSHSKSDVVDFSEVTEEVHAANVHGLVTLLSPITQGWRCSFFDGTLCDGHNSMRVVGFSSRLQDELEGYRSKDVVELRDREVKTARRGVGKFELMLKSDSRIKKSPEKLDMSKLPDIGNDCPVVMVKDIESK